MLTANRLRKLLRYEPETGLFVRLLDKGKAKAGDAAGSARRDGYVRMRVDGVYFLAHRLAWLYMTGSWPANDIDHRDGNPGNNAWNNLRDVSRAVNIQNQTRPHRNSGTGLLGVGRTSRGFQAQITAHGHHHHLGYFDTPADASCAYQRSKAQLHSAAFAA